MPVYHICPSCGLPNAPEDPCACTEEVEDLRARLVELEARLQVGPDKRVRELVESFCRDAEGFIADIPSLPSGNPDYARYGGLACVSVPCLRDWVDGWVARFRAALKWEEK